MKKQILTVLLSASFLTQTFPAAPQKNKSWGSYISSFVLFPDEVTHDTPLAPDQTGLIQLSEKRIHELHDKIKYNFIRRNQLSYGSLALKAAVFGIGLYQLGFFNLVAPAPKSEDPNIEALKLRVSILEGIAKVLAEKAGVKLDEMSNAAPKQSRLEWFLNGTKSITTFCALGLVTAKILQINNYIEAKPTIAYFLSRHNLLERLEVFRKTITAAVQPSDDDIHSLDYHRRAITPMLQSIAAHLEKLVAFTQYYFALQDQELVQNQAMEDQSRRLYNLSNSFFRKMHAQMQKPVFDADIVAMVEEFKSDLTLSIKRCSFFEKEFVEQD